MSDYTPTPMDLPHGRPASPRSRRITGLVFIVIGLGTWAAGIFPLLGWDTPGANVVRAYHVVAAAALFSYAMATGIGTVHQAAALGFGHRAIKVQAAGYLILLVAGSAVIVFS